jgi:hypothetical protein
MNDIRVVVSVNLFGYYTEQTGIPQDQLLANRRGICACPRPGTGSMRMGQDLGSRAEMPVAEGRGVRLLRPRLRRVRPRVLRSCSYICPLAA